MRAVITGATSGIGLEMAEILHKKGYKLTLIARRADRLSSLAEKFGPDTKTIVADLSKREEVFNAFENAKSDDVEILINNAGFGLYGSFTENPLERELEMLDTNVAAPHILTKLFLREFEKKNSGYILNVASIASFFPGPFLASYYASKAYVRTLTESIYGELRKKGSKVYIGAFCPGPVKTEFDSVANVKFSLGGITAKYAADYALRKMFAKKLIILPSVSVKAAVFFSRFMPKKPLIAIMEKMQSKKGA